MTYKLAKLIRIKNPSDFSFLRREGLNLRGVFVYLSIYQSNQDYPPKLGITVTKRYGKAVLRNRFKRIARAAFRRQIDHLPKGALIHLIPRAYAKRAKSTDIERDLLNLIGS